MQAASGIDILILAAERFATHIADHLADNLDGRVILVRDLRGCHEALKTRGFQVLLVEESLALETAAAVDALYEAAGSAVVLELNFGIWSADRVARQVRSALAWRAGEERKVRKAVVLALYSELNATVSGLLLESQMALRKAGPEFAPSLQHLVTLAETLCERLRT